MKIMISDKTKIWFIIIFFVSIIPIRFFAQDSDDIEYKFTQTDSSFTFYGSFKIMVNPKCLLEISFDYEHIRALAINAKEVQLIDQGNNWNRISYIYQEFLFFRNQTVWHRTLNEENQRVEFTLMSSENNLTIMPQMISSSGYYQINEQEEYQVVEYYQQCKITEKLITKLYLNELKDEAIKFMHRFSEYAFAYCTDSTSTNGKNKKQKL